MSDSVKRTPKEQFDKQAAFYDEQWNTWSAETLQWIVDAAECDGADRAIDVATGSGFTAAELAAKVGFVIASDVSSGMLEQAKARASKRGLKNIEFVEAPAEKLPIEPDSMDIVTCRIAAHHFDDAAVFVREAYRVLKPGGRFALVDTTVPDNDEEASKWQNEVEALRDTSHSRNYPPSTWKRFAQNAGFVVESVSASGTGITIPLEQWITKAGCAPGQAQQVRKMFDNAPESARKAFKIGKDSEGQVLFTWMRVLLKAVKPLS